MKTTKKNIQNIIRAGNRTDIFKIAKSCGINVNDRSSLFDWYKSYATSDKIRRRAYDICFYENRFYAACNEGRNTLSPALRAFNFAKLQKKEGKSNYLKVLIGGNSSIYWASPEYGHSDYNKSIAMPNTEKNRAIARVINKYLSF